MPIPFFPKILEEKKIVVMDNPIQREDVFSTKYSKLISMFFSNYKLSGKFTLTYVVRLFLILWNNHRFT